MKNFALYIGICLFALSCANVDLNPLYGQNTAAEKSVNTKRNVNFSKKSYNPANHLNKGGYMRYPRGIGNDKNINFGFQLGGSFALMDAKKEEKCNMGANFDLYMHKILKGSNTMALGAEIKGYYFLTNSTKFKEYVTPKAETPTDDAQISVGNWIAAAAQFSMLGNFNATSRFNIQLKLNAGPLVVMVPGNAVTFQTNEIQLDNSVSAVTTEYKYKSGISIGGSATIGADLLYALSSHTEFKAGVDFTYMRFTYDKEYIQPKAKIVNELRQFGVYNLHVGFAYSF